MNFEKKVRMKTPYGVKNFQIFHSQNIFGIILNIWAKSFFKNTNSYIETLTHPSQDQLDLLNKTQSSNYFMVDQHQNNTAMWTEESSILIPSTNHIAVFHTLHHQQPIRMEKHVWDVRWNGTQTAHSDGIWRHRWFLGDCIGENRKFSHIVAKGSA